MLRRWRKSFSPYLFCFIWILSRYCSMFGDYGSSARKMGGNLFRESTPPVISFRSSRSSREDQIGAEAARFLWLRGPKVSLHLKRKGRFCNVSFLFTQGFCTKHTVPFFPGAFVWICLLVAQVRSIFVHPCGMGDLFKPKHSCGHSFK